MRAEILIDQKMALAGARMLQAMIDAAPIPVTVGTVYKGDSDILMTYGMGHAVRRKWWIEHLKRGGRCIGWDLGYWGREHGAMRATIDHDHPQELIRKESPERLARDGIKLLSAKCAGPVMVVGLGIKTSRMLGLRHQQWEKAKIEEFLSQGHDVIFRPKRESDVIQGMQNSKGPIQDALQSVSLVICKHSNVAVDACIAGVPVKCEDGAAFALYKDNPSPNEAERLEFLQSLAYWNWRPNEAGEAWNYLTDRLS